jgi:hypothetical protein
MPGMNGRQLLLELSHGGHAPPALFISGYSDDVIPDPACPSIEILRKPLSIRMLRGKVHETIAHSTAGAGV